jgi:hypothetical protein
MPEATREMQARQSSADKEENFVDDGLHEATFAIERVQDFRERRPMKRRARIFDFGRGDDEYRVFAGDSRYCGDFFNEVKDEGCCDQSSARMTVGKFQGAFSGMTTVPLGAVAVRRFGIDEASVEECLKGCVLRAGLLQEAVAAVSVCRPDCRTAVAFR